MHPSDDRDAVPSAMRTAIRCRSYRSTPVCTSFCTRCRRTSSSTARSGISPAGANSASIGMQAASGYSTMAPPFGTPPGPVSITCDRSAALQILRQPAQHLVHMLACVFDAAEPVVLIREDHQAAWNAAALQEFVHFESLVDRHAEILFALCDQHRRREIGRV